MPRCQRGNTRDVIANCSAANGFFVVEGFAPERSVNDQIDLSGLDEINDVGAAFVHLEYAFGFDARGMQRRGGSASRGQLKSQRGKLFTDGGEMFFVTVV